MILGSTVRWSRRPESASASAACSSGCALVIRAKFLNARVDRGLRTLYQFRQP